MTLALGALYRHARSSWSHLLGELVEVREDEGGLPRNSFGQGLLLSVSRLPAASGPEHNRSWHNADDHLIGSPERCWASVDAHGDLHPTLGRSRPPSPQIRLDGRQVDVEIVQPAGQVLIDTVEIDIPVQVNDPISEPGHLPHRFGNLGVNDAILLEQRE